MSSRQNFTITAGEDRTLTLTARDADGDILNLTGATISWRLVYARSGEIVVTVAGAIVSAALGTFTVTLADTDTDDFMDGHYTFDAFVTISGTTTNAAQGKIVVSGQRILAVNS